MRSKSNVYSEIVEEIYIWFFIKGIGARAHIKHLKHVTNNFSDDSPSKIFASSIEIIPSCLTIIEKPKN